MYEALLELADDHLVLGHRLSDWCGHAPMLEEDLALPNMGLDCLGTAETLYARAGELEGKGRSADDLCYLRGELDYVNCLLVERPNKDFAHTVLKQLMFAAFMQPFWHAAAASKDDVVRGVAGKAVKEMGYHIRHAGEWVIRLGDGSKESACRMAGAVADLAPYRDELFESSGAALKAEEAGVFPKREDIRAAWQETMDEVLGMAQITWPDVPQLTGGRAKRHGELLGHMLAEMQSLHRAHPGAVW